MLDQIEAGFSLWDRLKKSIQTKEESVAARFVRLFASHGVHRNQIPRIFGHDLTAADVANDEKLLEKLTEEMQVDACSLFAIQREWLDGANSQIYPTYCFYKYPKGFVEFIDNIIQKSESRNIKAILLTPIGNQHGKSALFLLEEELGAIGEKSYYRYHQLSSEWIFSYGLCRAYLSAYIAICYLRGICVFGIATSARIIQSISDGKNLLGWDGEGCLSIRGKRWHPEDMALFPKIFLDGLDKYSAVEALKVWIELADEGYMKLGLNNKEEKNARAIFENELKKYI